MSRPRILVFPFPLLSHYSRCLMLAEELKHEFEIHFPYEEKLSALVRVAGFPMFTCETFNAEDVLRHSQRFSFDWMSQPHFEKIFLSQCSAIKRLRPEFIVGDASFTLKMAAEKCGVRMISLINGYLSRHYACTRRISRTHPAYRYSEKLPQKIFDAITHRMEALAFRNVHTPFRKLRKKYSLKITDGYLNELEGEITLICDLPSLFPQKKSAENFHFLGPLFYEGKDSEQELVSALDPGKKTILVSLGSTGDWNSLRYLSEEKFSCFNIVTAGDAKQILHAPHIHSKKFVNNMALLPYCDLMICHGGNGTIYQALSFGLPILAHTNIFEQEWNVQRLESLGLGRNINDCKSSEELMQAVVEQLKKERNTALPGEISAFRRERRTLLTKAIHEIERVRITSTY